MLKLILTTLLVKQLLCAPQSPSSPEKEDGSEESPVLLTKFHVNADIKFRYARTQIMAHFKNPGTEANKAAFSMVIPESAFISNFSMTIGDTEHVALVKEKEDAKNLYKEAVSFGIGAGIVKKNTRDSNVFNVNANLEPEEKVIFTLTYEELLERRESHYEYILNLNPGASVVDFKVLVNINESLPLTSISVPEILQSNEIDASLDVEESRIANVTKNVDWTPNNARVEFAPDKKYQQEAGDQGVAGKFVVRYDVDRKGQDSEIQVIDGYFVHYFVPSELPTLPKHAVFVLDISGSMEGEKIRQLKDAMFTVFDDMTDSDYFNLVAFSDRISHWNQSFFNLRKYNEDYDENDYGDDQEHLATLAFFKATEENKDLAISTVLQLKADGSTNINDAIVAGIEIAKLAREKQAVPENVKPMVVFLTDGLPSYGVTDNDEIMANIRQSIGDEKIPVFTIAFGEDTDVSLLQETSSQNGGISKRIYEGSDAALQLEDFFAQISSPLLSDVKFEYVGGLVDNSSVSDTTVNTLFNGGEFIISGKVSEEESGLLESIITGDGRDGIYEKRFCLRFSEIPDYTDYSISEEIGSVRLSFHEDNSTLSHCHLPKVYPKSEAQSFLQKLFAFQHIKQLLKKRDLAQSEEEKSEMSKNATQLALDNNFVTSLTSLVVIKPDESPQVTEFVKNIEEVPFNFKKNVNRFQTFGIQPLSLSFSQSAPTYDYYDDINLESFVVKHEKEEETTTSAPVKCNNGTLTLYSKTYNRGQELQLAESDDDLRGENFSDKAVTALLTGDCCWELHADPGYSGEVVILKPGKKYTSVTSLGKLFRDAESVKKLTFIC